MIVRLNRNVKNIRFWDRQDLLDSAGLGTFTQAWGATLHTIAPQFVKVIEIGELSAAERRLLTLER